MIPASSTKEKNQKGSAYEDDQEAVDPAIEDDHAVPCSTPENDENEGAKKGETVVVAAVTDDDVDVDDACEPDEVCTSNSTDASLGVTHIEPVTNNVGCTISDDFVVPPPALRRSTGHPESVPGAFSIVPGGQSNMLTRGLRS